MIRWISILLVFVGSIESSRVLELSDRFLEFKDDHNGPWMIKFYAPWCHHCKSLEPIWAQVAQSLFGTNVNVGRIDCTRFTSVAAHYSVSGFPTILYIEKDIVVAYHGDKTREEIVDFTYKMMGPAVRDIPNLHKMDEVKRKYNIFFLLISSDQDSEVEVAYAKAANQFRHVNYFFRITHSIADEALGSDTPPAPAVMIFKDAVYYSYSPNAGTENYNSSVTEWVNKERFPLVTKITYGNLHEILRINKNLAIAVLEEDVVRKLNATHSNFKRMFEDFCIKHQENYKDDFAFGWTGNLDLASAITMMNIPVPNFIVLNSTTRQYHLIGDTVPKPHKVGAGNITNFLDGIRNGSLPSYGGTGMGTRLYRMYFDVTSSLLLIWSSSPILTLILFGVPSIFFCMIVYTTFCSSMWVDDEEEDHEKKE